MTKREVKVLTPVVVYEYAAAFADVVGQTHRLDRLRELYDEEPIPASSRRRCPSTEQAFVCLSRSPISIAPNLESSA